MYYFYVLQSLKKPDWLYKGSTSDLRKRFRQHSLGEVDSTRPYLPLRLIYYEAYLIEHAARKRESSVKRSGAAWGALMGRVKEGISPIQK